MKPAVTGLFMEISSLEDVRCQFASANCVLLCITFGVSVISLSQLSLPHMFVFPCYTGRLERLYVSWCCGRCRVR